MKFLLKFILALGFLPYVATAQETGNKNAKSTEPKKDTVVVEKRIEALEEPVQMIEETYRSGRRSESGNKPYETIPINGVASVIFQKNPTTGDNEYGVLKNGKELLPMIFSSSYFSESYYSMHRILGIGGKYGVFDIETEKWVIPIQFDQISNLNSSAYIVRNGAYYGIVDILNRSIVPVEWSKLEKINGVDNYVLVGKGANNGVITLVSG